MNQNLSTTKQEQYVFLVEHSGINLETKAKGNNPEDYILEGTAAVFGEENNNSRVYEEKEYLPHLEYLNKKISQHRLVGELDHPEKFDVSLKSISHIIEKLEYNKADRSIKIRVRLLNTPHGQIAKTLVDAGYPLSISSRAAGSVMENKKVKIKKIFTYDLVADPGFEKAQLEKIYESANSNLDTYYKRSIVSTLEDISENFTENSSKAKIYSVNPDDLSFKKAISEDDKKTNSADMNKYVTEEEMNDYSAMIKKQLDMVLEKIKLISEPTAVGPNGSAPVSEEIKTILEKHENYMKYLAGNLDRNIQYTEYVAEGLDKNIEYSKYIAENLDKNISYGEYLAENLDRGISFMDYLSENLEKNINYSEYLAENLDKNISYGEYLAENLDKNISYSEYLAENLDKNISYGEYLAENLDKNISYGEYLAENIDRNIGYSEYLSEKIENNIAYSEYIAEHVEIVPAQAAANTDVQPAASQAPIAEVNESKKYTDLSSQINQLLEAANNQKVAPKMNESEHHFFRFLSEAKRNEFNALDEAKKEKVVSVLKPGAYFTETDITAKWDAALVESQEVTPKFLKMIPESIKPLFEALTEREKEGVMAQSQSFKLNTDYQIKNFWTTRPFVRGKVVGLVKLNENEIAAPVNTDKAKNRGYDNDYMTSIAEEVGRRFKK